MSRQPATRRRVSRRRYHVRRLAAAIVVVVVALGLVRVVIAVTDSGSSSAGGNEAVAGADRGDGVATTDPADPTPADAATPVDAATPADADADLVGTVSPASSDVGPAERRVDPPSSADPARVLIVGDSDAGTFGPYLQQLLRETGIIETDLDYKVSSGLARPDFYDWHTAITEKVPAFNPDIVVVTFGGNDAQFLADVSGSSVVGQPRRDADTSAWTAEYRDRVRRIVEYLLDDGRVVIWVGIPNHIDPEVTFRMQLQDQAVKAELAEWPEVRFVDTWTRFAGRNGNFAEWLIDPRDGQGKPVRASDGFHLNQTGAEILAIDIAHVVFEELRELGANL